MCARVRARFSSFTFYTALRLFAGLVSQLPAQKPTPYEMVMAGKEMVPNEEVGSYSFAQQDRVGDDEECGLDASSEVACGLSASGVKSRRYSGQSNG